MHLANTLAVVAGGMLLAGSVASATVINGFNWDYVYTGDQLPTSTDAKWSVNGGDGSSAQHLQAGTITLTTPFDNFLYMDQIGEWAPSGTAYAEFKVKVDSFNDGEASGTSLNVFTAAGGGTILLLRADGIHLLDGSGDAEPLAYGMDPTAFHVYRVAASTTTDTYSVDVDGVTVLSNKPLWSALNADILRIGDPGSNTGGVATYEYVAFNNSSAPVAIPEPASAALFGLIGVMAMRRRRANVA